MKHTTTVAAAAGIIIAVGILNSAGVTRARANLEQPLTLTADDPYETVPIIDAYYNGEKMWFIRERGEQQTTSSHSSLPDLLADSI